MNERIRSRAFWLTLSAAIVLVTLLIVFGRTLLSYAWSNAGMATLSRALLDPSGSAAHASLVRAKARLDRAVWLDGANSAAHRGLGWVSWLNSDQSQAGAEWRAGGIMGRLFLAAGKAVWSTGAGKEAEAWFQRALAAQPELGDSYYYEALFQSIAKNHAQALALADQALSKSLFEDPDLRDKAQQIHDEQLAILVNEALSDARGLRRAKDYEGALDACERAVAVAPEFGDGYACKADVYRDMVRWADVVSALDEAISRGQFQSSDGLTQAEADRAEALDQWWQESVQNGMSALKEKDHATALTFFEQAIAIQPNVAEAYFYASQAYAQDGEFEQALALIDESLLKDWNDAGLKADVERYRSQAMTAWLHDFLDRGGAAQKAKDYSAALDWYGRAEKLAPELGDAYYYAALVYEATQEWDDALALLDQALSQPAFDDAKLLAQAQTAVARITGERWQTSFNEAEQARKDGDYEKALAAYERTISLDPNLGDGYYGAGLTYDALGQTRDALAMLDQAVAKSEFKTKGLAIETHFARGDTLRRLERFTDAISDYEYVVSQDPNNYWANVWLGLSWWKGYKDDGKAELYLQKAIRLKPNVKTAFRWLGVVYQVTGRKPEAVAMYQRVLEIDPEDDWSKEQLEIMKKWVQ